MTARAALDGSSTPKGPRVSEEAAVLDTLYELLAEGTDPSTDLTLEDVERFLHEHARSPKPREEILAFARAHKLPTEPTSSAEGEALAELASGLHSARVQAELPTVPLQHARQEPPAEGDLSAAATQPRASVAARSATPSPARTARGGLSWAVALLAFGVLGAGLLVFWHARRLQFELNTTALRQRATELAVGQLERKAQRLEEELSESERAREELAARLRAEGEARPAEAASTR